MREMIDLSSNNHPQDAPIDWVKVKEAGIEAAMIKATEGVHYVNPWLERDALGAHDHGLLIGYYHFAHPGQYPARHEVNHFWQTVKAMPRSLGLSLDLEETEGRSWRYLSRWGEQFIARIPQKVEQRPLYSNQYFLDNLRGAPWHHGLWLAEPGRRPRRAYWAWQYATGPVAGIVGDVDRSLLAA